jgi:hypothetical protein
MTLCPAAYSMNYNEASKTQDRLFDGRLTARAPKLS